MPSGVVLQKELESALDLPEPLKQAISAYEKKSWAADLTTPAIQGSWKQFLRSLESALKKNALSDQDLIQLIDHLATKDTVFLLEQIGRLDVARQARFLDLLNWVATEGTPIALRDNAQMVRERILMAFRLNQYPKIYSKERLDQVLMTLRD